MKYYSTLSIAALATALAGTAGAATITNGISSGTIGSLSVDTDRAGDSRTVNVTVNAANSGVTTQEVVFDYFAYIDTGSGGERLANQNATAATGDATSVTSTGSFTGSGGNDIAWSVVSSIAAGSNIYTNTFQFEAATGTLGTIQLAQYLDEDPFGSEGDVFFTRGSAADGTLELFTIDADELAGISHGGAYSESQGLQNASFDGFAADTFNQMKPRIGDGDQAYSLTGVIEASLAAAGTTDITGVGTTLGTEDIVSALAWSVDPNAAAATIVTTLGGIPDLTFVPPVNPPVQPPVAAVPLPASAALFLAGLASLGLARRRKA